MANRALQTQRNGTEVAGHNLANVNTPGKRGTDPRQFPPRLPALKS
jgi:flagellar basal body rod protein FlgG